ncbi:hypothetical protein HMPREF9086_3423 [Enterobacter hormaechei ATCC 49162]|nr:hypothetical protein HMPREF9086_3423 [Enterobacter hormaechei ATCC 49162]
MTPLRSQLACFSPNIFCKKSGEVIGMDAAGQSIKRRFGKCRNSRTNHIIN